MKLVQPGVFQIGETRIIEDDFEKFLAFIGAEGWSTDTDKDGQRLIEVYGRLCYDSFAPGRNLNVNKVREGNDSYLKNILDSKHGSVIEHCLLNFVFVNVSKVFTEELVRHRVGVAISGESGRYVRRSELVMWVPPILTEGHPFVAKFLTTLMRIFDYWIDLSTTNYKLDDPSTPFSHKKKLTSAIRRFLPIGKASHMGWSANLRTIRHCLNMRTSPHAEEEMIICFNKLGEIVCERYPNVFQDVKKEPIADMPGYLHYKFE